MSVVYAARPLSTQVMLKRRNSLDSRVLIDAIGKKKRTQHARRRIRPDRRLDISAGLAGTSVVIVEIQLIDSTGRSQPDRLGAGCEIDEVFAVRPDCIAELAVFNLMPPFDDNSPAGRRQQDSPAPSYAGQSETARRNPARPEPSTTAPTKPISSGGPTKGQQTTRVNRRPPRPRPHTVKRPGYGNVQASGRYRR